MNLIKTIRKKLLPILSLFILSATIFNMQTLAAYLPFPSPLPSASPLFSFSPSPTTQPSPSPTAIPTSLPTPSPTPMPSPLPAPSPNPSPTLSTKIDLNQLDVVKNGIIDQSDLQKISSSIGKPYDCQSDANGDGQVNTYDLITVRSKVGLRVANPRWESCQLIITFQKETKDERKDQILSQFGLQKIKEVTMINALGVKTKNQNLDNIISELKQLPEVKYAEKNYIAKLNFTPNDPRFRNQGNLRDLKMTLAWDETAHIGASQKIVYVAVMDTGVDTTHPDLADNISAFQYNAIDGSTNVTDTDGHGTAVTGIIAAVTNNGRDIAGIAKPGSNIRIIPIKVCQNVFIFSCNVLNMVTGFQWAVERGAKIVNMSLGFDTPINSLHDAITIAWIDKKVRVVAAAGNDGKEGLEFPASHPNALGVGFADLSTGQRDPASNWGDELDYVAPGFAILTLAPRNIDSDGLNFNFGGSSAATAHVSGVLALSCLVSGDLPDGRNVCEIRNPIARDLNPPGWDKYTGNGFIDAYLSTLNTSCKRIDFNADGEVNVIEAQMIAYRYGVSIGNPLYEVKFDLDPFLTTGQIDYDIDIKDLLRIWGLLPLICP